MPDDISVVGFDDIPLAAYFDPPLTTVRLPAHDLGRAVGVALLDRINGRRSRPGPCCRPSSWSVIDASTTAAPTRPLTQGWWKRGGVIDDAATPVMAPPVRCGDEMEEEEPCITGN